MSSRTTTTIFFFLLLLSTPPAIAAGVAQDFEKKGEGTPFTAARHGAKPGPVVREGTLVLVDGRRNRGPLANSVAFARTAEGTYRNVVVTFGFAMSKGSHWEEPNLRGSLAVGLDVHNPPTSHWFTGSGNVHDQPEREVSLHWDGIEITGWRSPVEFRDGEEHEFRLAVRFAAGGAYVTIRIDETAICDERFFPGIEPFESRLAFGGRTGEETSADFLIDDIVATWSDPAPAAEISPEPKWIRAFDRTLFHGKHQRETKEVELLPGDDPVARVVLVLTLSEPPGGWDEWDRSAAVYAFRGEERIEIVRWITPYRRNYTWRVDVTDYQSILRGKTKMQSFAGAWATNKTGDPATQEGFHVTIDLLYYPGKPERHAFRVENLYALNYRFGNTREAVGKGFPEIVKEIPEDATAGKVRVMMTGHGGFGEFTPAPRTLTVSGTAFTNTLWKTDVYLNPCRPQSGTWKFDRTGWSPGDVVSSWDTDITKLLTPGKEMTFLYRPDLFELKAGRKISASHWIEAQLILYRQGSSDPGWGQAPSAGEPIDRIERILMVAQDIDHGMPATADLTAEVNALLAMPGDEVFAALRQALDHGRLEGSLAQTFVPLVVDLARFLTNSPRGPRDEGMPLLYAVKGSVLLRGDPRRATPILHEVPELADVIGKAPKLRARLTPHGTGLLELLLAEPGRLHLDDSVLRDSLAAAIAFVAETDDDLLARLIEAVKKSDPAAPVAGVLAHALAGQLSFAGEGALIDLLERAAARDSSSVGEVVRALRNAGKSAIADGVRIMIAEKEDEASLAAFDRAAGPAFALRRLLADLPEEPGALDLRRLVVALRAAGPLQTWDELGEVLNHAYAPEDSDPAVVAATEELVRTLFWPRWSGRTEASVPAPGGLPTGLRVTGRGGGPANVDRLETVIYMVMHGGLRWAPRPFHPVARSPLDPTRREYVLANQPPTGVRATARLLSTTVRVVIENTGDDPLFVNPVAFDFAAARSLVITETRERGVVTSSELRLTLGALGYGMKPELYEDTLVPMARGACRTFTMPLPGPVPSGTKVFVELFDPAEPPADCGLPPKARRLRSFRGIRALIDETPLTDSDRRARALLDRIVLFDPETADDLDLTAAANELLALGREPVTRALETALDRGCREGTLAEEHWSHVLSLACALRGVPPHPTVADYGFQNLAGFVVFVGVTNDAGFHTGPLPDHQYPPGLPDLGGDFPSWLEPDPFTLLARCLEPDERVERWLRTDEFRRTAGRALGEAGRHDPPFAKRILAELRGRVFADPEDRDVIGIVLAYAAGRLGGDAARSALREKVATLSRQRNGTGRSRNLRCLVPALRMAGGEQDLIRMAGSLGRLLDGELRVRGFLDAAEEEPSPSSLKALAEEVIHSFHSPASPETLLRALELAFRLAESEHEVVRVAATELVLAILWPYQNPVRSSRSFSWSPEFGGPPANRVTVMETGRGFGGWPDPIAGARWLREQIREGVVRLGPRPETSSLFTETPVGRIDGRSVAALVRMRVNRKGDRLRIVLKNRATGPVCVNPLAFRLASARVVDVIETRDREVTKFRAVRLFLGWGFYRHETVISPDQLVVLDPGETTEFTFALEKGLPPDTRITVCFRDRFEIDGPLPCPRLATVEDVEVK